MKIRKSSKKILIGIFISATFLSCAITKTIAASTNMKAVNNLTVNIDLTYEDNNKNQHDNNPFTLKDKMILARDNHQWSIVQNQKPSQSYIDGNKFILLTKMDKADSQKVIMQFLVVDAGKNQSVISQPKMMVRYGQKGQIGIKDKDKTLKLAVLASQ